MPEAVAARTSTAAVASLVLGLGSFALFGPTGLLPLFGLTGLPALTLGLYALRAVNASDGRLRGRRLALAGILLGAVGTAITVVGVLAMVVLQLRARADLAGCANNLRQVGMAVNRYADNHDKRFPPGTVPNPALAPEQRLSWLASLLPYLDEPKAAGKKAPTATPWADLAGTIDYRAAWDAPGNREAVDSRVGPYLCPAHPAFGPRSHAHLTTYVGLAGVGPDAPTLPVSDPRAGVFGYDRTVTRQDVTAGISFTMMVAETARDNGPWAQGGPATVRPLDPDEVHYIGAGRPFGGLHPGGAQVLWVDTSVRFVSASIDPETFRAQATLRGR